MSRELEIQKLCREYNWQCFGGKQYCETCAPDH